MAGKEKLKPFKNAVGYWGRAGTWRRVEAEQTPELIRVWLQDKMIARGRRCHLFLPVSPGDADSVACTCEKITTNASQRRCDSCYGTKAVPGYLKFLHDTIFFATAEHAILTLSNTFLNTKFKPFPIQLTDGQLTGTITTPDKPFTNPRGVDWEIGVNAFLRAPGATVTLEFSTDSGVSYSPVTLTGGGGLLVGSIPGAAMTGSGVVRLRITMTRVNITDAATSFEIVRLRRTQPENINRQLARLRPDMNVGEILVEKTWVRERAELMSGQGRIVDHLADGSWTNPLDFFDVSIVRDTPEAKISDAGTGPHPFYQMAESLEDGTRYSISEIDYDTQLGVFTYQGFVEQRAQQGDPYFLVF